MVFLQGRRAETNVIGASGPRNHSTSDQISCCKANFFGDARFDSLFGQILRKDHHFLATEVGCKKPGVWLGERERKRDIYTLLFFFLATKLTASRKQGG